MRTILDVLAIASALAGAVLILWPAGGDVPSITVSHRDELPTYLRKQARQARIGGRLALASAVFQAIAWAIT